MVVQHNLTAMNSNRMLGLTTKTQAKSTERLSSGYKINRAADDAAGLSISEKMRKQIFLAIANRIKEQVPEIKFIDLWNEHLADITTNTAWPTPSLFVEFEPYDVRPES